jgi:hypothetical protein
LAGAALYFDLNQGKVRQCLPRGRKPDMLLTAPATADLHHVRERRAARDFNFAARAIGPECQLDGTAGFKE